jgi:protein-S-isoprenylcysteine O-methyltransferase Ste14
LVTYAAGAAVLAMAHPVWPTYAIGAALAALGIGLRVWACGHLRKNRELVTSGPYAHVQHPLYLGTFLIATGAIIAAGSPQTPSLLIWAAGGPMFLVAFFAHYLPRKRRVEGERLAERFPGEFAQFRQAVPAFVPSVRRYPGAGRQGWSGSTFRANHELGMDALVAGVFAIMVLMPQIVPWS